MKMYRKRFYCLAISSIVMSAVSIPTSFAATKAQLFKPSKAGRISTVVANTILNGVTPPKNSEGIDGDFYIDTKALLFYGPKTKSRWPSPTSIRGPQGQTGANGSNGTDARPSANVVTAGAQGLTGASGAKGEQGLQGIQGIAGVAGAKGETGPMGPPGANGSPGSNGAPGANGAPGSAGPQGVGGAQGARGASGADGATGQSGPTGATGAVGPSTVYTILIPAWTLSTSTAGGSADSLQFGNLSAGKSYRYSIIVHGVTTVANSFFGVEVKVGPLAIPTIYESAIIENIAYVGASFIHRFTFIIDGTLVGDSSDSWLKVGVVDAGGATSGASKMTLSGQAIVQLVGQVIQTS